MLGLILTVWIMGVFIAPPLFANPAGMLLATAIVGVCIGPFMARQSR